LGAGQAQSGAAGDAMVQRLFALGEQLWLLSESELDRLDEIQRCPRPRRDRRAQP
jgi:hypothetical protein